MTKDEGRRTAIVVAAAVVERDGLFLLTRRLKGTHLAGTWEFPGGKCEPSESPENCLVREIQEELAAGVKRTFLEDGDSLVMRGWSQGDGYRVGFGEVEGTILAAE